MIALGIDPRALDEMSLVDLASWRSVLGAYHDALDAAMKRERR